MQGTFAGDEGGLCYWAKVAFAARCARRIVGLLKYNWHLRTAPQFPLINGNEFPAHLYWSAVDTAWKLGIEAARTATKNPHAAKRRDEFYKIGWGLRPDYGNRGLNPAACVCGDTLAALNGDADAAIQAICTADVSASEIAQHVRWDEVLRTGLWGDYERRHFGATQVSDKLYFDLRRLDLAVLNAEFRNVSDDTPVPQSVFETEVYDG